MGPVDCGIQNFLLIRKLGCGFMYGLLACMGCRSAEAATFRSHSSENEWQSATKSALGGIGFLSENHVDQFLADPSSPASDSRKFVLQFLSIGASVPQDLVGAFSDFSKIAESRNDSSSGVGSTVKLLDGVRGIFGKRLGPGLSVAVGSLKVGGFTMAPYFNAILDAEVRVPSLPRASLSGDVFGGLGLGYAREFGQKVKWTAGLAVRPGERGFLKGAVDVSAAGGMVSSNNQQSSAGDANAASKFASWGAGFYMPVDVAFALMPHKTTRFNLVAKNLGGAPALNVTEGSKPPVYPMRISLGGSWTAYQTKVQEVVLGSELQDMLHMGQPSGLWYRWQWAAAYRARLPFRSQTSFGLNCGLQSGYPALGVFLDLFIAKLEVSRSVREAGFYIGQRPEARLNFRLSSQMAF